MVGRIPLQDTYILDHTTDFTVLRRLSGVLKTSYNDPRDKPVCVQGCCVLSDYNS